MVTWLVPIYSVSLDNTTDYSGHPQRLDPAVMHVSCIQAGTLLARLGRPEVSNCIAGLEQYSYSYEEAGDQAIEMRRVYTAVRSGELELNHMASVAPRVAGLASANHAMLVDEPLIGGDSIPPLHSVCVFLTRPFLH
jgi:hypothetical protein